MSVPLLVLVALAFVAYVVLLAASLRRRPVRATELVAPMETAIVDDKPTGIIGVPWTRTATEDGDQTAAGTSPWDQNPGPQGPFTPGVQLSGSPLSVSTSCQRAKPGGALRCHGHCPAGVGTISCSAGKSPLG